MNRVFLVHSQKLVAAWPRMSSEQQEVVTNMLDHYEREFLVHQRAGSQPEGIATAVHDTVDEYLADLMANDPHASEVRCREGCSHCCQVHVTITDNEARLLHWAALDRGLELDDAKLRRQAGHTDENWNELPLADQACVFLDAAGSCRVYAQRPTACRKYFVLSDPALCDTQTHPRAQVLNFVSIPAEVVSSATLGVFRHGSLPAMLLKQAPAAQPLAGASKE